MNKKEMENLKAQLKDFRADMKKALKDERYYQYIDEDEIYHVIEKDGNDYCLSLESNITEIQNINLNKIAYIYYCDSCVNIDSEIGDFEGQIEMENDFDKLNEYLTTIEYKFNTDWSKRQIEKIS